MNSEALNERLNELLAMEKEKSGTLVALRSQVTQIEADLYAISGAKQDVQYWISKMVPLTQQTHEDEFTPMQETAPAQD